MSNQDELRTKVKLLKAYDVIDNYKEIVDDYIGGSYKGFLNWLNNQYDFGAERYKLLSDIVDDLMPQL